MEMKTNTIKGILEQIDAKEILLPSMQRKFVWSEEKITNLFDSILREYPFGSLTFWEIENKEEIDNYCFYEFIKDYSLRENTINSKTKSIKDRIDVVMDGQQRLTSLYIGLKGSITTIAKYKKKEIAENWKKKYLYIVPHIEDDERNVDETPFRFYFEEKAIVSEQNKQRKDSYKYYLVSDLYGKTKERFKEIYNIKYLHRDMEDWRYVLERLRSVINDEKVVHSQIIKNTKIEDVLEIFKRINNGGTPLSPANLLFSTVITSWEEGREEMDEFITNINHEEVIFIREDFLIKSCIYLLDKQAAAKLDVLTSDVVEEIKINWARIKQAIIDSKNFLKSKQIFSNSNSILSIFFFHNCSIETSYLFEISTVLFAFNSQKSLSAKGVVIANLSQPLLMAEMLYALI